VSVFADVQNIISALTAFSTVYLGVLTYRRSNEIRDLKEKNEHLKKAVHKITSKVDPESDRKLMLEAKSTIQIMGINSLGPIHHCREELIKFLDHHHASLDMILLDIRDDVFKRRENHEADTSSRLASEWKATISILKDISNKSNGTISIRLRKNEPSRSLLIIDSKDSLNEKSKMLINYYPDGQSMRGYEGVQFLSEFVMERDRDSIYKNIEYYNESWMESSSISLEELHKLYVVN